MITKEYCDCESSLPACDANGGTICVGCGRDAGPVVATSSDPRPVDAHAAAGGDLCVDDGSGCCSACGVSLGRDCGSCDGNGYHRAGCPESEEVIERALAKEVSRG